LEFSEVKVAQNKKY